MKLLGCMGSAYKMVTILEWSFYQQYMSIVVTQQFCQDLVFSGCFVLFYPFQWVYIQFVVSVCILLKSNNVKHLFICFVICCSDIFISFFVFFPPALSSPSSISYTLSFISYQFLYVYMFVVHDYHIPYSDLVHLYITYTVLFPPLFFNLITLRCLPPPSIFLSQVNS